MYRQQLFANEVMLLPYYIAALNIEHAYYELTGEYEPFEGLCFVDTLNLAKGEQNTFVHDEENTERVERQKQAPITVMIGNPPYNVGQLDRERQQQESQVRRMIDRRIRETYVADSTATTRSKLNDTYVKFFRWARRPGTRDGIVCFVTNKAFVDQIAFDGMRKHSARDFAEIYHLDLAGNVRQNPNSVRHTIQRLRNSGRSRDHARDPQGQVKAPSRLLSRDSIRP